MTPPAADTMPAGTGAKILRRVAGEKFPKFALGDIASAYHLTFAELQAFLAKHGYPDPDKMRAAAEHLEQQPGTQPTAADGDQEPAIGTLLSLPVTQVHPDPDNPRDELTDIDDLADSIAEIGLLQPIVVRRHNGRFYVVAGHRRLAAALKLRWTDVPCIVRNDMRPDEVLAAMLIENGQRADLDPIEEARGLNRLKTLGNLTDAELARKVGRSQPVISARLALLLLTPEEQQQVRTGQMSLVEAAHKGRLAGGKVKATGQDKNWHLGPQHDLSTRAKARCERLSHPRGRRIGGMACGACWESVIRADERENLNTASHQLGRCVLCDHEHDADAAS